MRTSRITLYVNDLGRLLYSCAQVDSAGLSAPSGPHRVPLAAQVQKRTRLFTYTVTLEGPRLEPEWKYWSFAKSNAAYRLYTFAALVGCC
jgi:hypothetical protein